MHNCFQGSLSPTVEDGSRRHTDPKEPSQLSCLTVQGKEFLLVILMSGLIPPPAVPRLFGTQHPAPSQLSFTPAEEYHKYYPCSFEPLHYANHLVRTRQALSPRCVETNSIPCNFCTGAARVGKVLYCLWGCPQRNRETLDCEILVKGTAFIAG